jgi:uncharacterized protein
LTLYLDTSALVKLYVDEEGGETVRGSVEETQVVVTSSIAYVEARVAFARRHHEGGLSASEHRRTIRDLDGDWPRYLTIEVVTAIIREAARLADTYRLRAYDAVHLASATTANRRLGGLVFASWDGALERAARREGLEALPR